MSNNDKKPKRKASGVTTHARARYNKAMKQGLRDDPDFPQPSVTDWVTINYPKGLVYVGE